MKTAMKKLSSSRGFTLAETLICVLILLMVTAIVGAALPTASNAYTKAVDAGNAQVLLSTGITLLRNELSTATKFEIAEDGKSVSYRSGTTGSQSEIYKKADGEIWIKTWYGYDKSGESTERPLVTKAASTSNLTLTFDKFLSPNDDGSVLEIKDLVVTMKSGAASTEVVSRNSTLVRLVADVIPTEEPVSGSEP